MQLGASDGGWRYLAFLVHKQAAPIYKQDIPNEIKN